MPLVYKNLNIIGFRSNTGTLCGEMGLFLFVKHVVRTVTLCLQMVNVRKQFKKI